jgi:hypothetical protein
MRRLALSQTFGHEVKLIPPHYVKPYVKRGKNDAARGSPFSTGPQLSDAPGIDNDEAIGCHSCARSDLGRR